MVQIISQGAEAIISKKGKNVLKDRITKISDLGNLAGFFWETLEVDTKLFGENYENHLKSALEIIKGIDDWKLEKLSDKLMSEVKSKSYKTGDFFMDLRIAITGKKFTPPINESMIILGKKETLKRIKQAL